MRTLKKNAKKTVSRERVQIATKKAAERSGKT